MLKENQKQHTFIDLFSGCGGLSLGLTESGWVGRFAIEKAKDAFATFKQNFLSEGSQICFDWPEWLEKSPQSIGDVLENHPAELRRMRGSVDVVAGGPPCQGFSFSGRRKRLDPRNRLFRKYVDLVSIVQPRALILENVPGMLVAHGATARGKKKKPGPTPKSHYDLLIQALDDIGYVAVGKVLDPSRFGVPQRRPRLIVIGIRKSIAKRILGGPLRVFDFIEIAGTEQLKRLGLGEKVSASEAISDLEKGSRALVPCAEPGLRGTFYQPDYQGPTSTYQKLMHKGFSDESMDSIRLANHTDRVRERFALILKLTLDESRRGFSLSDKVRGRLGLLKNRTVPMSPDLPAPTITTLPDDVLHYKEPRILRVRETARLQSFPDWFKFRGKYTTGGERRKKECPRYTQVGNAVPPLLARAIGVGVARALSSLEINEICEPQAIDKVEIEREVEAIS